MEYTRKIVHTLHEKRKILRLGFFLCLLFLSSAVLFLYYYNNGISQEILITQTQERQQVIARAGKMFITGFFTSIQKQLFKLSVLPEVKNQVSGKSQQAIADSFTTFSNDPSLFAMGFINAKGIISSIADKTGKTTTIGEDYSYREYFTWTKDRLHKGQTYLSDPFISRGPLTRGRTIAIMTIPVYSTADRYQGAVFALILLDEFTKTYVTPLAKINPEAWIINREGVLLAGGDADEIVGTNFFDYAKKNTWSQKNSFESGMHAILGENEATFHWFYRGNKGELQEMYGASEELDIFNRKVWLVLSNQRQKIVSSVLTPFALAVIPVFSLLSTLFLGFVFVFVARFAKKDIYIEGFLAGKASAEQEKKK